LDMTEGNMQLKEIINTFQVPLFSKV